MQFTLADVKLLLADSTIESACFKREIDRLVKENADQRKTIEMLGEQLKQQTAE